MDNAEIGSAAGPVTVKVAVAVAPLWSALLVTTAVIAVVPNPTPVAIPELEPMVATCVLLELHVSV